MNSIDIAWFIPAVFRYRRVLAEVLLASMFLQVLALISPMFFQVVIDKVLVHRGLSTLDVLVVGLVVVSIFEPTSPTSRSSGGAGSTSRPSWTTSRAT